MLCTGLALCVLALPGCITTPTTPTPAYMTVDDFARRIGGRTQSTYNGTVTVEAPSNKIVLTPGAGMVLVNDRPHRLNNPVTYRNGVLSVPDSIMSLVNTSSGTTSNTSPNTSSPGSGPLVVIDPGHGGRDDGASYGGVGEKEVNLSVSLELKRELERMGYRVQLTRSTDVFLPLQERTAFAKRVRAALFVSVHANAARNRTVSGIEVFFPAGASQRSEQSKRLADTIHHRLEPATVGPGRGVNPASYVVLATSHCPAVLVEVGFLSHATSRAKLATASYQRDVAQRIAQGIDDYAKTRNW